jgi:hypothetical protein
MAAGPATSHRPYPRADLAATVFVDQEQGLYQWFVTGKVTNVGNRDYTAPAGTPRTVRLEQVTRFYYRGVHEHVVVLATTTISNLKAGESVPLGKVFAGPTEEPRAGTLFRLVISPGDGNTDNDQAAVKYPR